MNKDTFCILPWIHTYVDTTNDARACCEWQTSAGAYTNPQETINLPAFKRIRKELYSGTKSPECSLCWKKEDKGIMSNRELQNHLFADRINKEFLDSLTNYNDFSLNENFRYLYLDIRSSNLCNYKCRFCSLGLSSSWYQYEKNSLTKDNSILNHKNFDKKSGVLSNTVTFNDLQKHIPHVTRITLAGGEPVMMPQTYDILYEFIKQKNFNVKVSIISNTSRLQYNDDKILDLLSQFKEAVWTSSIDATHDAHAFLRSGTNDWNTVFENTKSLSELSKINKNFQWQILSSVGWINLYRYYDVWKSFHNEANQISYNGVIQPPHMQIKALPQKDLKRAYEFYQDMIDCHKGNPSVKWLKRLTNTIKNYLTDPHPNQQDLLLESLKFHTKFDKVRKQSFFDTFPEWQHFKQLVL